jgi:hypothetical protein
VLVYWPANLTVDSGQVLLDRGATRHAHQPIREGLECAPRQPGQDKSLPRLRSAELPQPAGVRAQGSDGPVSTRGRPGAPPRCVTLAESWCPCSCGATAPPGSWGPARLGTCGGHKQPWRASGGPRQDLGLIQGTPRFRSAPVVPVAIPVAWSVPERPRIVEDDARAWCPPRTVAPVFRARPSGGVGQ